MSQVLDLQTIRSEREAATRAVKVFVKREVDPECADRTYYVIGSESRDAIQSEISGLMAEVEAFGNGYAHFDGPHRFAGLYYATGHTVVHIDPYATPEPA